MRQLRCCHVAAVQHTAGFGNLCFSNGLDSLPTHCRGASLAGCGPNTAGHAVRAAGLCSNSCRTVVAVGDTLTAGCFVLALTCCPDIACPETSGQCSPLLVQRFKALLGCCVVVTRTAWCWRTLVHSVLCVVYCVVCNHMLTVQTCMVSACLHA
ncbi:hypothetical protein COO60DRAFT_1283908, partial [Scenedesmus sp. NREL 46B-D3]